jgi:hypothetical protein
VKNRTKVVMDRRGWHDPVENLKTQRDGGRRMMMMRMKKKKKKEKKKNKKKKKKKKKTQKQLCIKLCLSLFRNQHFT